MRLLVLKLFCAFAFVLTVQHSFSQSRQLGTWKVFMPYSNSIGICDAGDKVYCGAHYSVFSCLKGETSVIQTYDKSNGLSDVSVQTINYDPQTKFLAIAYTDNNLDFIYNGTDVYNIPDMEGASINGSVSIYSISFYNGNAYISSDLGVSVVNLTTKQIDDTYKIGPNGGPQRVYASCSDGINIYAATDNGIKYASLSATNLADFNSWHLFSQAQNIPLAKATNMAVSGGTVYAVIAGPGSAPDTLYQYNLSSNNWQKIYFDSTSNDSIVTLAPDFNNSGTVYLSTWNQTAQTGGKNISYTYNNGSGVLTICSNLGHSRPLGWFENNGISWEADYYNGLFENHQPCTNSPNLSSIAPIGPLTNNAFRLNSKNKILDVAPGGADDSWNLEGNSDGFFTYQNDNWTDYNRYTFNDSWLANFTDILCTTKMTSRKKTYFGSFLSGLIERDDNTGNLTYYDKNNSILEGAIGDTARTKISCLTTDQYDNVWVGNAGAPSLLKVIRSSDLTWEKFNIPIVFSLLKNMIVDQQNQVWALTRQQDGVVVFTYSLNGGTLDNPVDSSVYLHSGVGVGNLPNNNVFCLAEDHDGNIWVGTEQGIGVFYCAANVFYGGCDAEQIKVVGTGGYIGYLFGMQTVRAIAVDAANRKWIGTTEGLWLISADGQTQLLNFNTINSPMPANQVTDITIDNETGEVFIGTTGGLVSYQGDAIDTCIGCTEALVYPNPVKPDYTGPIAIKGLVNNAYVKITDISGTLIYQGQANGTQMIWNGMGYTGNRAKSGVYLVFSSDSTGKQRRVAKILITN